MSFLVTRQERSPDNNDVIDSILNDISIDPSVEVHDQFALIVDMAKELGKDCNGAINGTITDVTITRSELLYLIINSPNNQITLFSLDQFFDGRTLHCLERFLHFPYTSIIITRKLPGDARYQPLLKSFSCDAMGNLNVINSGDNHAVIDVCAFKKLYLNKNIFGHCATSMKFKYHYLTRSLYMHYRYVRDGDVYTKSVKTHPNATEHMFELYKYISGFKVLKDLKTLRVSLIIDPRAYYDIENPWYSETDKPVDEAKGYSELIRQARMLTEYYKLNNMLGSSGIDLRNLPNDHIRLFGLGRFFVYNMDDITDPYQRKLNELYVKYGWDKRVQPELHNYPLCADF